MRFGWFIVFFITAGVAAANETPVIKKLQVVKQLQGEQGVEQIVVRGVASDAEDGPRLSYSYRIVSGGGTLEPVKRYAIYHPEEPGMVVFELTVTDSAGVTVKAATEYRVGGSDPKQLYTDKATWMAALTPKYRKQPAFQFVERDPNLPNVLLIGDSISIGYTPYVREALKEKCNVYRIPENGGDSKKALAQFEYWMGDGNWDVIHFNTGLHDMKRLVNNQLDNSGDQVNSPAIYRVNLENCFRRLKSTGAKLIWANITVVPEGAEGRIKGEEVEYNQIAENVRQKHPSIGLNDLYTLTASCPADQKPANVHFEEIGKERQAKQVAEIILEELK
jgi:acyl-CoA thioesterase-1